MAQFDSVRGFREGFALCKKGSNEYFIDQTGCLKIQLKRGDHARDFHEELAWYENQSTKGFIDKTGKLKINLSNGWEAGDFQNGLALVRNGQHFGFINNKGEVVIPLNFSGCHDFKEGLAMVTVDHGNDFRCGFIDKTGKWVIPPKFHRAQNFSEGLAAVCFEKTDGMNRFELWQYSIRNSLENFSDWLDETYRKILKELRGDRSIE